LRVWGGLTDRGIEWPERGQVGFGYDFLRTTSLTEKCLVPQSRAQLVVVFEVMGKKWANKNIPGALHFLTANCLNRVPAFCNEAYCRLFFQAVKELKEARRFKLIAYVLMPDHCHLIVNPRDGQIKELTGAMKGLSARYIIDAEAGEFFAGGSAADGVTHQLWQESFKDLALWSGWMIWQKINYIHNNPVKAGLVKSAGDYKWSSFRAFYSGSEEPLAVDRDWWWTDDVKKLAVATREMGEEEERG
jgi:putative transposase